MQDPYQDAQRALQAALLGSLACSMHIQAAIIICTTSGQNEHAKAT